MENRLQLRHSDILYNTREDVIDYINSQMIFESNKQALFAEPLVFKYGTNDNNPNIILAIGSHGDGTNNINNKYFIIDTALINENIESIKKDLENDSIEISKIFTLINELKEKDDEILKNISLIEENLSNEIERAQTAENNISEKLNQEINRSENIDQQHEQKITENKNLILSEIERAKQEEVSLTVYPIDTDTIHFTKVKNESGTTISSSLKLSQLSGQVLKVISTEGGITEGLYLKLSLEYDQNTGKLSLLANDVTISSFNLPLEQFLDSELTYYNPDTKEIILVFREQGKDPKYVNIPIGDLVDEYTAGNGLEINNNKFSVKLNNIANEKFLTVDEDGLALTGIASAISEAIETEDSKLESVKEEINNKIISETNILKEKIEKEIDRASESEIEIENKLTAEITRATDAENSISSNFNIEIGYIKEDISNNISKINAEITRATEAENNLRDKIDNEINRATDAESAINTSFQEKYNEINDNLSNLDSKIVSEINRATNSESTISNKIDTVELKLDNEIERSTSKDELLNNDIIENKNNISSLSDKINDEINRSIQIDTELESKIDSIHIPTYSMSKKIFEDSGDTPYASEYFLTKDGEQIGEPITIVKDQFLENVEYSTDDKILIFTFRLSNGSSKTLHVELSDFVDEYTAGNGISIIGNSLSIKLNTNSNETSKYLSVNDSGLTISGVENSIDDKINEALTNEIEQLIDTKINEVLLNKVDEMINSSIEKAFENGEFLNKIKENIITNTVFKQKVIGDTDVVVDVDEGKSVTIGLGDNCTISAGEYPTII